MALTTSEYKAMRDLTSASAVSRNPFKACKRNMKYTYIICYLPKKKKQFTGF